MSLRCSWPTCPKRSVSVAEVDTDDSGYLEGRVLDLFNGIEYPSRQQWRKSGKRQTRSQLMR